MVKVNVGTIIESASFFALLERPLYVFQFKIIGPNNLWFSNQNVNLSEHFENAQAEIKINTVVGRPGTTIPTYPKLRDRIPIEKKIGLCTLIKSFGKNLYKTTKTSIPVESVINKF